MLPYETEDSSPYMRLRVGRVLDVHAVPGDEGTPGESQAVGCVKVEWMDRAGSRDLVPIAFSAFSNPVTLDGPENSDQTAAVGRCYGDISLPSKGDLAVVSFRSPASPVVIGYLPANYFMQTSTEDDKDSAWGTMRRIVPGEFSRKSAQQAEVYQDKAGAVQIIVKAQPVDFEALDGSATSAATDIDAAQVPRTELARVIVGEAYTDETFAARAVGASGKKLVLEVRMASGAAVKIDTAGAVEVTAAPSQALTLNGGTKGVARKDDAVKSTSTEDAAFWGFLSAFVQAFQAWSPAPLDGGAALKSQLTTVFAQYPQAPDHLTSKVTAASETVKAGD